jgi:hypothetical protein
MSHDSNEASGDRKELSGLALLLHPVVLVTLLIVGAVVALISMATLGLDKGVLIGMARQDYARGVITYLFAIMTIGAAVVIILSALLGRDDVHAEKRFHRGKEILSLLLGVFGTIVGFYFGAAPGASVHEFRLSAMHVGPAAGTESGRISIEAVASGGNPPYMYGLGIDSAPVEPDKPAPDDGWIVGELAAPPPGALKVRIVVQDAVGDRREKSAPIASQR